MTDVTPVIPSGRNVIETYGEMRFHISGVRFETPIIVLPEAIIDWSVSTWEDITEESFQPLLSTNLADVVLLGCGTKAKLPSSELRRQFREAGMVIEPMDTGAACRTYNVLMAEDRRVAAALMPVA